MKSKMLGALIVSVCLTGQSFGFGLLDMMLGCGCGCDSCEPQFVVKNRVAVLTVAAATAVR